MISVIVIIKDTRDYLKKCLPHRLQSMVPVCKPCSSLNAYPVVSNPDSAN